MASPHACRQWPALSFAQLLRLLVLFLLGCAAGLPARAAVPTAEQTALEQYRQGMALAVQGEMARALPLLRGIEAQRLEPGRRAHLGRVLARFRDARAATTVDAAALSLDAWTAGVLADYRRYWHRAMLAPAQREAAERELARRLAGRLGRPAHSGMDELEPLLEQQLARRGWHALFGLTLPLREFMLWRSQQEQRYTVALPEGEEQVPVAMLDGFASYGWVGFATAERSHTGGWTTPERLFCVRSAYQPDSEAFRVSYLAHEGQHFADKRRFPALEQPELEYRAKLTELALAEQTQDSLLQSFADNQSERRSSPHAHANRQLTLDLAAALGRTAGGSRWWQDLAPAQIRSAAHQLLRQDSARRAQGPG